MIDSVKPERADYGAAIIDKWLEVLVERLGKVDDLEDVEEHLCQLMDAILDTNWDMECPELLEAIRQFDFVKRKGIRCPHCGSHDIWTNPIECDADIAAECGCNVCDAEWFENYELISYSCLVAPLTEDAE